MKLLVVVLFAVCIAAQATNGARAPKVRDWSKIRPKYPTVPTGNETPKRPVATTPLRRGTKDMRAECGISNPPAAERIVGGWESGVNEFPWQVAVFIDDTYFCGGSLLDDQWVLTAAHCAEDAGFFDVMLGAHNVRLTQEEGRIEVRSTEYYVHPSWSSFLLRNDLALIHLPEPVTFTDKIRPICLPSLSEPDHAGNLSIATGWGRPSDAVDTISPVLRKTNATVITNTQCDSTYSIIIDSHICISTTDGHGTCNGDSGGPLSVVDENGRFHQVGIVSFGSSLGCEVGLPAAFTRLSSFLDWVSSVTGIAVN